MSFSFTDCHSIEALDWFTRMYKRWACAAEMIISSLGFHSLFRRTSRTDEQRKSCACAEPSLVDFAFALGDSSVTRFSSFVSSHALATRSHLPLSSSRSFARQRPTIPLSPSPSVSPLPASSAILLSASPRALLPSSRPQWLVLHLSPLQRARAKLMRSPRGSWESLDARLTGTPAKPLRCPTRYLTM